MQGGSAMRELVSELRSSPETQRVSLRAVADAHEQAFGQLRSSNNYQHKAVQTVCRLSETLLDALKIREGWLCDGFRMRMPVADEDASEALLLDDFVLLGSPIGKI